MDAIPPLNTGRSYIQSFKYQLRVAKQGTVITVLLVQLAGKPETWEFLELKFDDKYDRVFRVGIRYVGSNVYEFVFGDVTGDSVRREISIERLVREMKAGRKLSITPVSAGGDLVAERLLFELKDFTISFNELERAVP